MEEITDLEQLVEKAIAELDPKVRKEYDMACEIVPELVKEETKIAAFLRCEDNDVQKAAQRLSMYWKLRKELFASRWMLPMNQTGTGALNVDDIQALRSGYLVCVPMTGGRLLVLYDESRLSVIPKGSNCRVTFYLTSLFTNDPRYSSRITILHVVHGNGSMPAMDLTDQIWMFYRLALPFKVNNVFVGQAYEEGKTELIDFLGYQVSRKVQYKSGNLFQPKRVASNSSRGVLKLLESEGLEREALPRCLGGDYEYDEFSDWIRMRISLEDIMSSTPYRNKANNISPSRMAPILYAMAAGQRLTTTAVNRKRLKSQSDSSDNSNKESEESEKDTARKRNAVYSRRLYHKRKLEIESLQGECNVWESENAKIRKENETLENLLTSANQILQDLGLVQQPQSQQLQQRQYEQLHQQHQQLHQQLQEQQYQQLQQQQQQQQYQQLQEQLQQQQHLQLQSQLDSPYFFSSSTSPQPPCEEFVGSPIEHVFVHQSPPQQPFDPAFENRLGDFPSLGNNNTFV